jgi:hypothetical protein
MDAKKLSIFVFAGNRSLLFKKQSFNLKIKAHKKKKINIKDIQDTKVQRHLY